LYKTLNKFVIGAMELDEMMEYTEKDNLLIVGNRTEAHRLALEAGASVLITGGFDTEDYVKKIADEKTIPIISTSYDTFTVATLINRAIYDQLIKKEIVHVDDIFIPIEKTTYLSPKDSVEKWYDYNKLTTHSRYPVIDSNHKVVGMITSKDVIGLDKNVLVEKMMTKQPITINGKTSVATAGRMMVWEGVELLPVVNENNQLQGIIGRQEVIKSLQMMQRQPQIADTLEDIVTNHFDDPKENKEKDTYKVNVTPQMSNALGTLSNGVFITIITEASQRLLRSYTKSNAVIESISVYFIGSIQIETTIEILPKILGLGRKFAKVDVEVHQDGIVVGKALLMIQLIDG
jgi:predicted transcriptional regulator